MMHGQKNIKLCSYVICCYNKELYTDGLYPYCIQGIYYQLLGLKRAAVKSNWSRPQHTELYTHFFGESHRQNRWYS